MTLTYHPALEMTIPELAALFTRAFKDYISGSVQMEPPTLAGMLARENADLNLSQVARCDGEPVGFGLIARQGWTIRLAAMGIVPEAQGQQVGAGLLAHLMDQGRARGEKTMVLEVYEQNTRAVKLYEKYGFRAVRRLYAYKAFVPHPPTPSPAFLAGEGEKDIETVDALMTDAPEGRPYGGSDELIEVDVLDVARMVMTHGRHDLPWQMSGTTLARLGAPLRAFKLDEAGIIVSDLNAETVAIRALIVPPEFQNQGQATGLLETLWAAYPGKTWSIPAICPEEYGIGFLEKRGFERQPLNQFQMAVGLG